MTTQRFNTTEEQLAWSVSIAETKAHFATHNRWLEDDKTLKVYIRRAHRLFEGRLVTVLDIGSVEANPVGTGRFTRFLEYVEEVKPFEGLYVECVHNTRFADFFRRRNYREFYIPGTGPSNLVQSPANFYRLWS